MEIKKKSHTIKWSISSTTTENMNKNTSILQVLIKNEGGGVSAYTATKTSLSYSSACRESFKCAQGK